MRRMPRPRMYDEGGKVPVPNQPSTDPAEKMKQVSQGAEQSGGLPDLSTMKDRLANAWDKGGEMEEGGGEEPDPAQDEELNHQLMGELFDAFEKKDKKGALDSMRAIVMSCGGKV